MRTRHAALLLLICFIANAGRAEETPPAPLAEFACTEWLGVAWPRILVTETFTLVPGKAKADAVALVDGEGGDVPFQLHAVKTHPDGSLASASVSFYAELAPKGSYRYRVVPRAPKAPGQPVRAETSDTGLELGNGITAIRLPASMTAGDRGLLFSKTSPGGAAPEAGVAPGPVSGIRLADGTWTGGSCFWAKEPEKAPKVKSIDTRVVSQGPLFAEAEVRYMFDNGGYYVLTARVIKDDPAIRITEQCDTKAVGSSWAWRLHVSLTSGAQGGWRPDWAYYITPEGRLKGNRKDLYAALGKAGFDTEKYSDREFDAKKIAYNDKRLFATCVWYPWAPVAHYFGLVDSAQLATPEAAGKAPFLGVIPVHAGFWRGAHQTWQTLTVDTTKAGDVVLQAPLQVEHHPRSSIHLGEYDPEMPFSVIRRQWFFVAGPAKFHETLYPLRRYDGYITLDDYKDWILEWEDTQASYPRLLFDREKVEAWKKTLATHPGKEELEKFLYFNDDPKRLEKLWNDMGKANSEWSGVLGHTVHALVRDGSMRFPSRWHSSFRHGQMGWWAGTVDEMLSSQHLTPEQRTTLRAWVAAAAYALTHPDFNPRGSMIHLGPANMPMNRFGPVPSAAALIPDHPKARHWLAVSAAYLDYYLQQNTAPGGAWNEVITYYHAGVNHLMQAGAVLEQSGLLNERTARLAGLTGMYTFKLLTPPDPLFQSRRVPSWGHEGAWINTHWLLAAALTRNIQPEWSTCFKWAWDQLGRPMDSHHDAKFSERIIAFADTIPQGAPPEELRSVWMPGFGGVMRAQAGDPNETYFCMRQGYCVSHSDGNQGDWILYAKGAPLATISKFTYALHNNRPHGKLSGSFGWHSRVRFGSMSNSGGWPGGGSDSNIRHPYFSDSVDYFLGWGGYGPQAWSRQAMMLKGRKSEETSYVVMRDSFTPMGANKQLQKKWWYLRTPGPKSRVTTTGDTITMASPQKVSFNARFLMPASTTFESRESTQDGPIYFQAALNWQKVGAPVKKGKGTNITIEETMTVTAAGPIEAGQDILVVLFPQSEGEAVPAYELLAPGVARIKTSTSTDYVFVGVEPFAYEGEGIRFQGQVGVLRLFADEAHFVLAEDGGTLSYKGTTLETTAPATKVLPVAQLGTVKTFDVPKPEPRITFALDPAKGPIEDVAPGVKRQKLENGEAYLFESDEVLKFEHEDVKFTGRRGGVEFNETTKTIRLVRLDPGDNGHLRMRGKGGWVSGPIELIYHGEDMRGRNEGKGRFVWIQLPDGADKLVSYWVDGLPYMPGGGKGSRLVPLMDGYHEFRLVPTVQPPLWQ